jgi:sulfite dehydrogenase (quinone) subunit SoeC
MSKRGFEFRVSTAGARSEARDRASIRISDLSQPFRAPREWSEGRGLLLILAHFLTGTGAGAWLFAALFDLGAGLVAGFSLVALGGFSHLFFLGHPERFWRMMKNFAGSWVSRGLIGMTLFSLAGGVYLLCLLVDASDTVFARTIFISSLVSALWIVVYKGFVWASSTGIPLWNTPLVPILYIAYALRAGTAVLIVLAASLTPQSASANLEPVKLWLAISTAVLVLVYVSIMRGGGATALRSVHLLMFGRVAVPFYLGAVVIGLIIPIAIGAVAAFAHVPGEVIALAALFSLLGDLSILYCIAKAGLYRPLPG